MHTLLVIEESHPPIVLMNLMNKTVSAIIKEENQMKKIKLQDNWRIRDPP